MRPQRGTVFQCIPPHLLEQQDDTHHHEDESPLQCELREIHTVDYRRVGQQVVDRSSRFLEKEGIPGGTPRMKTVGPCPGREYSHYQNEKCSNGDDKFLMFSHHGTIVDATKVQSGTL